MKRFHLHLSVTDLEQNIRFYSTLFGQAPNVVKPDYAKWMLDDPKVNFAISTFSERVGIDHLGFQADDAEVLDQLRSAYEAADRSSVVHEENAACCYAVSNKHWVTDPQGLAWEAFQSLNQVPTFHGEHKKPVTIAVKSATACCGPGQSC
jgi:catechol 2,3-dioxygenase-like lactoylglutathione lyase family enzyme